MFSVAMAIATRTPPVPMTTPIRPSKIQTVAAIPRIQRALRPTATALRFGPRELSFEELDRSSSRTANGLLHAGLKGEARVAILSQDSDEVFELLFGIAKAGCVMTGINWRLAAPEVQFILENGEVEALFFLFWGTTSSALKRQTPPALARMRTGSFQSHTRYVGDGNVAR